MQSTCKCTMLLLEVVVVIILRFNTHVLKSPGASTYAQYSQVIWVDIYMIIHILQVRKVGNSS